MIRIAEFEKVPYEQYRSDLIMQYGSLGGLMTAYGIKSKGEAELLIQHVYDDIKLPTRATTDSAGYDFFMPMRKSLSEGTTVNVPTGIRVKMEPGWVLMIFPRSGLGFKYRIQLDNTVGIIDGDYYNSDNYGHIHIKITNDGYNNKCCDIDSGQGFAQGIFVPFGITFSDKVTEVRNGGFGSTTKITPPSNFVGEEAIE